MPIIFSAIDGIRADILFIISDAARMQNRGVSAGWLAEHEQRRYYHA